MNIQILVNNADDNVTNYQDAIRLAGKALLEKGYINADYIQACIARETDYPTGLLFANGSGIAIPHASAELVNQSSISVVRVKENVEFGLMEDASLKVGCNLVFNLALNSGEQHLTILRKLIRLFQDEVFVEGCQTMTPQQAAEFITAQLAN